MREKEKFSGLEKNSESNTQTMQFYERVLKFNLISQLQYFTNWIEKSFRNDETIISSISVTDIVFDVYLGKWNYRAIPKVKTCSYFLTIPKLNMYENIKNTNIIVTIQPPPNQLANIDFDVIGTSDY